MKKTVRHLLKVLLYVVIAVVIGYFIFTGKRL